MKQFRVVERQSIVVEYIIEAESKEAWESMNGSHTVISREELECNDCEVLEFEELE